MDNKEKCVEIQYRDYDLVRVIATIFVVIGHSLYLNITTTNGGVNYTLPENLSTVYYGEIFRIVSFLQSWVYGFHMALFFMLSGAVYAIKEHKSFDGFAESKIKRLIIPYFVYGICFMLPVKYIAGFYTSESIGEAITSFLGGGDSGHLWYLSALFWCFIVFFSSKKL